MGMQSKTEDTGHWRVPGKARLFRLFAIVEARRGEFEAVAQYVQEALRIHEVTNTQDQICGAFTAAAAGFVEAQRGDHAKALQFLEEYLRTVREQGLKIERWEDAEILETLSFVHAHLGNIAEAARHEAHAQQIRQRLGLPANYKLWVLRKP